MIDFHKTYIDKQFKMQKKKKKKKENQIHCNGTCHTARKIIQLSEL